MGLDDQKPGQLQQTFSPPDSGRERGHSAKRLLLQTLFEREERARQWEDRCAGHRGHGTYSATNRDYDL